jgi:hypothetical protein
MNSDKENLKDVPVRFDERSLLQGQLLQSSGGKRSSKELSALSALGG